MDWYIKYNMRCADEVRLPKCLIEINFQKKKPNQKKPLNGDKLNISVNFMSRKDCTK